MTRRAFVAALATLFAAMLIPVTAHAQEQRSLSLSASQFSFAADPGQTGAGEVFVVNEGPAPVMVRVYVADQVVDDEGTATYVVPSPDTARADSPASWITFELPADAKSAGNIPYIELDPGERVPVAFEAEVPHGVAPGDRQAVLFFEMYSPDAADPGTARANARLGARIQTRVNGEVVEKMDVRPFTLPAFVIGRASDYEFTVRNEGNVDQRVNVRIAQLDRSENEVGSSAVMTDTPVYASTNLARQGELQLQGMGIGPQHLRLVLDYVGDSGVSKSVAKDRTVWAVPVWLLVALAALLSLLFIVGLWSAASRSTERRLLRDAAGGSGLNEGAAGSP
ncbi:MAG TPA: hypothetical protein VLA05_00275 [Coriobacteriia bacterium]|nr:hypothetical protein [Coriobacteriia bacterium]